MSEDDFQPFVEAWLGACENLKGGTVTEAGANIAFEALKQYSLEVVLAALTRHIQKADWNPTVSEIITQIEGERPTVEVLAMLAVKNDTPLGRYVRYLVSDHAVQTSNQHGLLSLIKGFLPQINDFIDRGFSGSYTADQERVLRLGGYELDQPVAPGLAAPVAVPKLVEIQEDLLLEDS